MADGSWASASGGGGAQDHYIGSRLSFNRDIAKGDQILLSNVTLRGAVGASLALLVGSWLCAFPAALVFWLTRSNGIAVVFWLALVVLLCIVPWREWIAQWELTLDGMGDRELQAFATISQALVRHHIPVQQKSMRVRPQLRGNVRSYHVLTDRPYTAYVGVFAYGDGLFMTWSMWRSRRLVVIPWLFLWQGIRKAFGHGNIIRDFIRTDRARAMREAVHNAVREGVDAAASSEIVDISEMERLPIEDLDDAAHGGGSAVPGRAPVAPGPPPGPPMTAPGSVATAVVAPAPAAPPPVAPAQVAYVAPVTVVPAPPVNDTRETTIRPERIPPYERPSSAPTPPAAAPVAAPGPAYQPPAPASPPPAPPIPSYQPQQDDWLGGRSPAPSPENDPPPPDPRQRIE